MTISSTIQTQTETLCDWIYRTAGVDPLEVVRRQNAILRQCGNQAERVFVMDSVEDAPKRDRRGPDPVPNVRALALRVIDHALEHGVSVPVAVCEILGSETHPDFKAVRNRVEREKKLQRKTQ